MKRLVRKDVITITYELDIEIITSMYSRIVSSSSVDLTDTDYDKFIMGMIYQFKRRKFGLMRDEEYTHDSNFPGSLSEYYTFIKWIDNIQLVVVVNVKVSDHPDKGKRGLSAEEKRANYVSRIADEIAHKHDIDDSYGTYLDIIFDDKHLKSYSSAQMKVNSEIRKIESEVNDMIEEGEFQ